MKNCAASTCARPLLICATILIELERTAAGDIRGALRHGVRMQDLARFLADVEERILSDDLSLHEISSLLNLMILLIWRDRARAARGN